MLDHRTKMFHVKHFCPIVGAEYARRQTFSGLKCVRLSRRVAFIHHSHAGSSEPFALKRI
jgi:hypothetical protein